MSRKSVFCITTSREQAERIVDQLKTARFSNNDISVLFPDKGTTRDFAHEKNTTAPEGAVAGAGTGGVIGGALGWIAGIGALAIPGVGPFIAAGPILAALSGAAVGATVGGIAGGLIGLGIPEIEAKRYEARSRRAISSSRSTPKTPRKSLEPRTSSPKPGRRTSAPRGRRPPPRTARPPIGPRIHPNLFLPNADNNRPATVVRWLQG